MRRLGVLVGVLACLAAGPATKPTTPAIAELEAAEKKITDLTDRLEKAKAARIAKLRETPAYKALLADRDAKKEALEKARKSGTPQEKIDASSAYGRSQQAVAKADAGSVLTDDEKGMQAELAAARRDEGRVRPLATADQKRLASQQAVAEAAAAKKKAIEREKADATEVTVKQIDVTGERYVDKVVKLIGCEFNEVGNYGVDDIPGVTISTNGLMSLINTREQAKWINVSVSDKSDRFFHKVYATKDPWFDRLEKLPRRSKMDIYGVVVKLDGAGNYGIIMADADLKPAKDE